MEMYFLGHRETILNIKKKKLNLEEYEEYYMKRLIYTAFNTDNFQNFWINSSDHVKLFSYYIQSHNKTEYLQFVQEELEKTEHVRMESVSTLCLKSTNFDVNWMNFFKFLIPFLLSTKLIEIQPSIVYTFFEDLYSHLIDSELEEHIDELYDLIRPSFNQQIPLSFHSSVFFNQTHLLLTKEDFEILFQKIVIEFNKNNINSGMIHLLNTIHNDLNEHSTQEFQKFIPFLVKKYFDAQVNDEIGIQNLNSIGFASQQEQELLISKYERLFNKLFEEEREITQALMIPIVSDTLISNNLTARKYAIKLIAEYFRETNDVELLETLFQILKEEETLDEELILALNTFFSLMVNENMNQILLYIYNLLFELLKVENSETVYFSLEILTNLLNNSNNIGYDLNIDLIMLCETIVNNVKKLSNFSVGYLPIICEIFHTNNEIDGKNIHARNLFELVLTGAETASIEAKYDFLDCLQYLIASMKYDTRDWFPKLMKLSIGTLRSHFQRQTFHQFELTILLGFILIVFQQYKEEVEFYISGTNFLEMISSISSDITSHDDSRCFANAILMELCFYRSKTLEISLPKMYELNNSKITINQDNIALHGMVLYYYNYKPLQKYTELFIEKVIAELLSDNFQNDELRDPFSFPLLSIGFLAKTNFKLVDSRFSEFGKIYKDAIIKFDGYSTKCEMNFVYDSFSDLVLNNLTYSSSQIFPQHDLSTIHQKLQVYLLMNNKYFNLLPDLLEKCHDLKFKFK
eukprot:gene4005-7261_t